MSNPNPRRVLRKVGDEEYRRARQMPDNKNIIKAVLAKYRGLLPRDAVEDCGMVALWRALKYHEADHGTKFTTSLHRFCHWEAKRELRRMYGRGTRRRRVDFVSWTPDVDKPSHEGNANPREDLEHVKAYLAWLPVQEWLLVTEHYFEDVPLETMARDRGVSKECVRKNVARAVAKLRKLCLTALSEGEAV